MSVPPRKSTADAARVALAEAEKISAPAMFGRAPALLWASPCSLVGVLLGLAVLALRGSARRVGPTLEVALRASERDVPAWADTLPFAAITFGHVIVGRSHAALAKLRAHERVHVRPYELLGPLFLIAYPASSLLALSRGRCPYRDNRFEREAFGRVPVRNDAGGSGRDRSPCHAREHTRAP